MIDSYDCKVLGKAAKEVGKDLAGILAKTAFWSGGFLITGTFLPGKYQERLADKLGIDCRLQTRLSCLGEIAAEVAMFAYLGNERTDYLLDKYISNIGFVKVSALASPVVDAGIRFIHAYSSFNDWHDETGEYHYDYRPPKSSAIIPLEAVHYVAKCLKNYLGGVWKEAKEECALERRTGKSDTKPVAND